VATRACRRVARRCWRTGRVGWDEGVSAGDLPAAAPSEQATAVDLVAEVAEVAEDRVVFHLGDVVDHHDAGVAVVVITTSARSITSSSRTTWSPPSPPATRRSGHLGDDHTSTLATERLRGALADIAIADDNELASRHHIGRLVDAGDEGTADAVLVVELRLRHRVVGVDSREEQPDRPPRSVRGATRPRRR
jgi:hypothetical protein